MPRIIKKRINFVIPEDLHVFAVIYIRNRSTKVCEGEKNDIEILSGKNIDTTKPCYCCNKIQSRNFYLFKYDEENKPVFFNSDEEQYAISFCIKCIGSVNISKNKYWKCVECNIEYSRSKIFTCKPCTHNNTLIAKVMKTIEKTGVLENNDINKFIDSLCQKLQKIKTRKEIPCDKKDIIYRLTNNR